MGKIRQHSDRPGWPTRPGLATVNVPGPWQLCRLHRRLQDLHGGHRQGDGQRAGNCCPWWTTSIGQQLLHSSVLPFFFIIFFSNHSNSNCRVISRKSCTGCRQDLWLWDECGLEDVAGLRQAQLHCNVQPHDHRRAESAYAQHGLGQVRTLSDSGTVSSLILVMVILWQKMIHIDQIPGRCVHWHWRHCRRRRDCHCCWGDPSIHCSLLYLWFSPIKIMVKYFWMQPGYLQTAQEIEVDMETIGDVSFSP